MAATPSTMIDLGTPAPHFTLPEPKTGLDVSFVDAAGERGTLVMFICNHCPFVIHVKDELAAIGRDYADRGIGIVAISSNDIDTHPDDAPHKMAAFATEHQLAYPYLYDETQEVAKSYSAACTPDFFLFDADHELVYRGQLDDSRPKSDLAVTGEHLRTAIESVLAGTDVPAVQRPSIGCNIKWKPGNEPAYYTS